MRSTKIMGDKLVTREQIGSVAIVRTLSRDGSTVRVERGNVIESPPLSRAAAESLFRKCVRFWRDALALPGEGAFQTLRLS